MDADPAFADPLPEACADACFDRSTAAPAFVWLASQSPRRAQLLDQLGVAHRLLLAAPHEDAEALEAERPGELPLAYVQRVTLAKLQAAGRRRVERGATGAPILCADTTVALGRSIFGKPRDDADAKRMLRALSGRTHRVLTTVAVQHVQHAQPLTATSVSTVRFAVLSDATIARYIAGGEPRGKAGAYAVQGAIAACIERIAGSYSGIMGLPLFETARLLHQAGVATSLQPALQPALPPN
ncbi:MAG: nucleoside triphosphate pyrophosphatase [Rubrivivax sp.]